MTAGAVLVVFLLLAGAAPLVLYALVRAEHDQRETMDRDAAEQAARRDTDTDPKRSADSEAGWNRKQDTESDWNRDRDEKSSRERDSGWDRE